MDDELKGRLQAIAQRAPEGRPDLTSVQRRGRRDSYRRRGLIALSSAACIALAGIGIAGLVGRESAKPRPQEAADHTGDAAFVPAEKGEPTYLLSDFEIYYPYRAIDHMLGMKHRSKEHKKLYCSAPGRKHACRTRRDVAGFSYGSWRWSGDRYPGMLDCRVRLFDKHGQLAGEIISGLSGLEPRSRPGQYTLIPVPVSARPVSAEAECEGGRYDDGEGMRFTFKGTERYLPPTQPGEPPEKERLKLIFDVEHLGDHVDSRLCRMKIWFESGKVLDRVFTTNAPEGTEEFETRHLASDPVTDAEVTCESITDELG